MGNQALKKQELERLVEETNLDNAKIKGLFEQFRNISGVHEKDGVIDKREFCTALGRKESPFMDRLFELFDTDGSGTIDFKEFICGLNTVSQGSLEDKIKFSFRIYDVDGNGFIGKEELRKIFDAVKHDNDVDQDALVDQIFEEADLDGDNQISFEEYRIMITKHPSMIQDMTEEKTTKKKRTRGLSTLLQIPMIGTNAKILFLGSGDGGKSTLMKQIEIFETGRFSSDQINKYKRCIHSNIIQTIASVAKYANEYGVVIDGDTQTIINDITKSTDIRSVNMTWDENTPELVLQVWQSESMRKLAAHKNEIHLLESMDFFVENIHRIGQEGYIPTNEDILKSKSKTSGITDRTIKIGGRIIAITDTAGQKTERKKWPMAYSATSCVVFVAALSEYTRNLYEDDITNRMHDSVQLFNHCVNLPQMKDIPFVLVLSKSDLLPMSLKECALEKVYPDYNGGEDAQKATEFIRDLYIRQYKGLELNKIVPIVSNLTDMDQAVKVLDVIIQVALHNKRAGFN